MVRPECYQCAACGKSWADFYPRLSCPCGCDVLRLPSGSRTASSDVRTADSGVKLSSLLSGSLGNVLLDLDDLDDQESGPWSPYPQGNGTEGVAL